MYPALLLCAPSHFQPDLVASFSLHLWAHIQHSHVRSVPRSQVFLRASAREQRALGTGRWKVSPNRPHARPFLPF